MTVKMLSEKLQLEVIAMPCGEREIHGAYICDLLSWVMGRAKADDAWITIMTNSNIVAVASLVDTACILLAEGVKVDDATKQLAVEKGVNILVSNKPSYETAISVFKLLS